MKNGKTFIEKIWFPMAVLYTLLIVTAISFVAFNYFEFILTIGIGIPCSILLIYLLVMQSNIFFSENKSFAKILIVFISRYLILIFSLVSPAVIIYILKGNVLFFLINVGIIFYVYLILVLNKKYLI